MWSRREFGKALVTSGAAAALPVQVAAAGERQEPPRGRLAKIIFRDVEIVLYDQYGFVLRRENVGHAWSGVLNRYALTFHPPAIGKGEPPTEVRAFEAWSEGFLLCRQQMSLGIGGPGDLVHFNWDLDCRYSSRMEDWPADVPQRSRDHVV